MLAAKPLPSLVNTTFLQYFATGCFFSAYLLPAELQKTSIFLLAFMLAVGFQKIMFLILLNQQSLIPEMESMLCFKPSQIINLPHCTFTCLYTTIPHFVALDANRKSYMRHFVFYGLTFDRNEVVYVSIKGFKDSVEEKNLLCSALKLWEKWITEWPQHAKGHMTMKFLFLRPVFSRRRRRYAAVANGEDFSGIKMLILQKPSAPVFIISWRVRRMRWESVFVVLLPYVSWDRKVIHSD